MRPGSLCHRSAAHDIAVKIAPLPLIILVAVTGLSGGVFAGWSAAAQQRRNAAAERARENLEKISSTRVAAGDLAETLRQQGSRAAAEQAEVVRYFTEKDEGLRKELAGRGMDADRQRKAVEEMEARVAELRKRGDMANTPSASDEKLLADARAEVKLGEAAGWDALRGKLDDLSKELSRPVQAKDKAALEGKVSLITGDAALKSLPADAGAWEQSRKAALEDWAKRKSP